MQPLYRAVKHLNRPNALIRSTFFEQTHVDEVYYRKVMELCTASINSENIHSIEAFIYNFRLFILLIRIN